MFDQEIHVTTFYNFMNTLLHLTVDRGSVCSQIFLFCKIRAAFSKILQKATLIFGNAALVLQNAVLIFQNTKKNVRNSGGPEEV